MHFWLTALLRISLGMFPAADYLRFREEVPVLVAVTAFVVVVFVVMLNLLVAQLIEAYHTMFKDMQGLEARPVYIHIYIINIQYTYT